MLETAIELTEVSVSESPKNVDFLARYFKKASNLGAFLCKSSLFPRVAPGRWTAAPTPSLRQLSAQLHVLGGMNLEDPWPSMNALVCNHIASTVSSDEDDGDDEDSDGDGDEDGGDDIDDDDVNDNDNDGADGVEFIEVDLVATDAVAVTSVPTASTTTTLSLLTTGIAANFSPQPIRFAHPYARSQVYDLRRYTQANMWGPFVSDPILLIPEDCRSFSPSALMPHGSTVDGRRLRTCRLGKSSSHHDRHRVQLQNVHRASRLGVV